MSSQPNKSSTNSRQPYSTKQTNHKKVNPTYAEDNSSHHTLPADKKNTSSTNTWSLTRESVTPRPPSFYNRYHHYQQCISRPFRKNSKQQSMATTTAIPIIPSPHARKPDTSTYKTTPTCTRTLNATSIHVLTCFTTLSQPICHPTAAHTCSIGIKKQMKMQPQVKEKKILYQKL